MPKLHGSANSDTKLTERRNVEGEYKHSSIQKVQNKEYLIKNACYSVTKYYLCKQNNKRSLLGRKQRSQVACSFPNRYQFSCINKVTSLFSIRYILIIIFDRKNCLIRQFFDAYRKVLRRSIVLIISSCFGRFSGCFCPGMWPSPTFLLWARWKWGGM